MADGTGEARGVDLVRAVDELEEASAWCVALSEALFGMGLAEGAETGTALKTLAQIPRRLARDIDRVAESLGEGLGG